ncbi:NAD-dependent succinate-semialdehyde dehydrogenase [Leucobacter sp. W1038]|uniref:NAD-dependent succinate-semialdehyde dehydrogenase n=1 Tax=Leucobacter sp. W1038 TaxID=3438281 RepID=UPI003D9839A9
MSTFATTSPRDGAELSNYHTMTKDERAASVDRSAAAFESWSRATLEERARVLREIARLHRERVDQLAVLAANEMGKPISQGRAEVEQLAKIFDFYADHGPEFLQDEHLEHVEGGRALVRSAPLGPVLGVMPWNFPYYQVARFVAPNLLLGNTILLKHARSCAATSIEIARIIAEAGAPEGVYENLLVSGPDINEFIADPRVRAVSLTGSEEAGRSVALSAAQHLKKCVLELGGSDPFIVLPDADIDSAVEFASSGRFNNAGQACTSAKRMIVHADVWDEFLEKFLSETQKWSTGDPLEESTKLGPLSSEAVRFDVASQVDDAVSKGARVHAGGSVPEGPGSYYPATVLTGVTPEMRAYREELFGPVAVLYRVSSEDEAIALANDTPFGLGAVVFSSDPEKAERIANALDTGMVGLNTTLRSQPGLPFGGVKDSGFGRELGRFGLEEFANKKLLRYAQ